MINIHHEINEKGILVFKLLGELKIMSAEEAKATMNDTICENAAKSVILDLSELSYLDSAGLAVFISAYKMLATEEGKLVLIGLKGQPKTIIGISDLQKIISVRETYEEALTAFDLS